MAVWELFGLWLTELCLDCTWHDWRIACRYTLLNVVVQLAALRMLLIYPSLIDGLMMIDWPGCAGLRRAHQCCEANAPSLV